MAPRLPAGFISVAEAQQKRDNTDYDVLGICTDFLSPAPSRGTDMTMTFTLWDTSCLDASGLEQDGMKVRCFSGQIWHLPRVDEVGDVVILRNLRTKNYGSQWLGLTNSGTRWNVIPGATLLNSNEANLLTVQQRSSYDVPPHKEGDSRQGRAPSIQILKYAQELLQTKDPSTLRGPPKSTALDQVAIMKASGGRPLLPTRQKQRLLKDLVDPHEHEGQQFVDLLGEVRRVYHGGNPVEVQMTDYTENPLLFEYTHQGQEGYVSTTNYWPGPWGQMTITVCAWDEHAEHIRDLVGKQEIQVGMYVRMKNVQIKLDRNGGMIQGNIRGAPGTSQTNIEFLRPREAETDKVLKALLLRKRDYNVAMKAKGIGFKQDEVTTAKRKNREDVEQPAGQQEKLVSKNGKKKEKKQKAKQANTNGRADANNDSVTINPKSLSNQHVRCEAIEIALTPISTILSTEQLQRKTPAGNAYELPFQNCKYKSKVQVVDFFPDKLEDFSLPYRISDYEVLSDQESGDDSAVSLDYARNNPDEVRWEWHFFLMVQDPQPTKAQKALQNIPDQPTMLLQVAGRDGDYLLNKEACDLRNNSQALAMLKEKLFVLWGDLEEKKTEHGKTGMELQDEGVLVSSKPFECLIKEYGVNARAKDGQMVDNEWERLFGLLKTNIG